MEEKACRTLGLVGLALMAAPAVIQLSPGWAFVFIVGFASFAAAVYALPYAKQP